MTAASHVAADYGERVERPCGFCGEDAGDCGHRTTWDDRTQDYRVLIYKRGEDAWSVWYYYKGEYGEAGGRHPVGSRDEALEYVREKIRERWEVPVEEVDLVARNCTYSAEELKGAKRLQRWS